MPEPEPPIHLYTTNVASIELRPGTTAGEIETWLAACT